jgi:hypothetical protein
VKYLKALAYVLTHLPGLMAEVEESRRLVRLASIAVTEANAQFAGTRAYTIGLLTIIEKHGAALPRAAQLELAYLGNIETHIAAARAAMEAGKDKD